MPTIPPNNTSGLYGIDDGNVQISNDLNIDNLYAQGNIGAGGNIAAGNNITAGGNVTAGYFIGDGSLLTNIDAGNIIGGYGNANVVSLMATFGSNTISTTGNITAGNFIGSGQSLTNIPGANVTGTVANATFATSAATAGTVTTAAQPNITSVGTLSSLSVTGNITGGNVNTAGNVTAGYFIGDGSQLTGLPASYGNANVAAYLPTYTGNLSGGNLTIGNDAVITNDLTVGGTIYGTFAGNISGNLVVPGGNTQVIYNDSGNAGASANFTFNEATNIMTVNGTANVGTLNASGNITGNYVFGNAAFMTGIPASYGNANVAAYLPTYTGNIGNTTSELNITGANVFVNSPVGTGIRVYNNALDTFVNMPVTGVSVPGATFRGDLVSIDFTYPTTITGQGLTINGNLFGTGNSLVATGNVVAPYFVGNGSQLTNLTGANVVGAVATATFATSAGTAGTVTTAAQPNITSVGNLTSLTVTGDGLIQGNLQVNGNVTYIASNTVTINDKFINVANNSATSSAANGGGLGVGPVGSEYATLSYSSANTAWQSNIKIEAPAVSTTGNISGAYIIGDGSQLTNINAGNIVGSYGNANVASFLNNFGSNAIVTTGNITGGNIIGNGQSLTNLPGANVVGAVANATFAISAGTATTASSANSVAGANVTGTVASAEQANVANVANSVSGSNVVGAVANATFATSAASATTATTAGTVTTNAQPNITSVGTLSSLSVSGNTTSGNVSATGTVKSGAVTYTGTDGTAGQVLTTYGNGQTYFSTVSGGSYGNANVANYLASGTLSSNIITTANVTASSVITSGASGNITGVNYLFANTVIANGSIQSTGPVTAGAVTYANTDGTASQFLTTYGNGQTYWSTPASYGNANVVTLLSNFGSNTIVTTGNITGGNLLTSGLISATGNITGGNVRSGAVTYTPTDGTNGQVLTTYGNGQTYFATAATTPPGGSNTQIQFNDGGAFGGNANMTYNKATGNITLGNIVINNFDMSTAVPINLANADAQGNNTPWRLLQGDGYNGSFSSIYSGVLPGNIASNMNNPRLVVGDLVTFPNTGVRFNEVSLQTWANLSANITNTNTRIGVFRTDLMVGGGPGGNTIISTAPATIISGGASQVYLGAGGDANLSAVGNIVTNGGATAQFFSVQVNPGSFANLIQGVWSQQVLSNPNATSFGNATTVIGAYTNCPTNAANANITGTTNYAGFYSPSNVSAFTGTSAINGSVVRMATNYHAFRNDDDLAKSRLGALERMHYVTANVSSSGGSITIDKNNGQVQQIYLTEAITGVTFSNFAVRQQKPNLSFQNSTDVVTLIFQQGATPYNITLPTGNAQIRYANGVSSVTGVANTTVMVDVVGVYNYNTSATNYLIEIKPTYS